MYIDQATPEQLSHWREQLEAEFRALKQGNLALDLTRGKPSAEQLTLANALDGILAGDYQSGDGTDTRNYGGIDGLPAMKALAAEILDADPDQVLVGGNSSLTLMYLCVTFAWLFGPAGEGSAWKDEGQVKFLCPSPGYDRHFAICEELGIKMIPVAITDTGPDMDQVESLIASDSSIKGIWCVPKYSNPTGCVYSDETVERLALLGKIATSNFRVFYDNAYAVHDLTDTPQPLASIAELCKKHGTEDSVIQFGSTSKVTFAGAGVAFMASSEGNIGRIKKHLAIATIGPDKVNQLRHTRLFASRADVTEHMRQHAALIKPRFDIAIRHLQEGLGDSDLGEWTNPEGGYFISFNARPGLAKAVVALAAEAGVKLTPAGATFPYGVDPDDRNIRIAPTFPTVEEIDRAMQAFVLCVKLAAVRKALL